MNYNSFSGWKKQISVNTIHPGAVNTGILDNYSGVLQWMLRQLLECDPALV